MCAVEADTCFDRPARAGSRTWSESRPAGGERDVLAC